MKNGRLSHLKQGDEFKMFVSEEDRILMSCIDTSYTYVFKEKIKTTYHYTSKGCNYSTSTNEHIDILNQN